nr:hypothetical protein [Tanacetum cinerariifolium]
MTTIFFVGLYVTDGHECELKMFLRLIPVYCRNRAHLIPSLSYRRGDFSSIYITLLLNVYSILSRYYFFPIEDLEALWSLVKERFSTRKPKNFFDTGLEVCAGDGGGVMGDVVGEVERGWEVEEMCIPPFSGTVYVGSGSSRKVLAPGPIGNNVDMLQRKVKGLAQQMFNRANTEYSTLKRLGEMDRALRQEKDQIEQAFRQVIEWIRKQFRVKIPPCRSDDDATTSDDAHP